MDSLERQEEIINELKRVEEYYVNIVVTEELRNLDDLIKARFVEMFGDVNTNEKNWAWKPLGELCSYCKGRSHQCQFEQFLGGDIPWIKIGDATDGDSIYLTSTKEYITQEGVKKSRLVNSRKSYICKLWRFFGVC